MMHKKTFKYNKCRCWGKIIGRGVGGWGDTWQVPNAQVFYGGPRASTPGKYSL